MSSSRQLNPIEILGMSDQVLTSTIHLLLLFIESLVFFSNWLWWGEKRFYVEPNTP